MGVMLSSAEWSVPVLMRSLCFPLSLCQYSFPAERRPVPPAQSITAQSLQGKTVRFPSSPPTTSVCNSHIHNFAFLSNSPPRIRWGFGLQMSRIFYMQWLSCSFKVNMKSFTFITHTSGLLVHDLWAHVISKVKQWLLGFKYGYSMFEQ